MGIRLASSHDVSRANPMGWVRPYHGDLVNVIESVKAMRLPPEHGLFIRGIFGADRYGNLNGPDAMSEEEFDRLFPYILALSQSDWRVVFQFGEPECSQQLAQERLDECRFSNICIDSNALPYSTVMFENVYLTNCVDRNMPSVIDLDFYTRRKRLAALDSDPESALTIPSTSLLLVPGWHTEVQAAEATKNPDNLEVILAKKFVKPGPLPNDADWEELPNALFRSMAQSTRINHNNPDAAAPVSSNTSPTVHG